MLPVLHQVTALTGLPSQLKAHLLVEIPYDDPGNGTTIIYNYKIVSSSTEIDGWTCAILRNHTVSAAAKVHSALLQYPLDRKV